MWVKKLDRWINSFSHEFQIGLVISLAISALLFMIGFLAALGYGVLLWLLG